MFDSLKKKFFGAEKGKATPDGGVHDVRIAACALLLEMANADDEFSEEEKNDIVSILEKEFGLKDDDVTQIIEAAQKELEKSLDLWQFTNLVNKNYSKEEKLKVIELVWKVVYSDGILDKHEDYLVHKLAKLLKLRHKELIDAKLKVIGKK
jgi:uncharacterized tellurite resistance protein B-like protein